MVRQAHHKKFAPTDERSKTRVKLASTMACKEEEDDSQYVALRND